jgi:Holliday junction resolvase RusA-like endonuclease
MSMNGHARTYKHPEQSRYEAQVAALLAQHRPDAPLDGPLSLSVTAYLPIPKSKPKRWQAAALAGEIWPTGKPDCSNILKNIEDIMNGVFWRDDAQIVGVQAFKRYSDSPRWEIEIEAV